MKGIVLFDYDGTLVDERFAIYQVSDKSKQAIKQLKQKGFLCLLATGRAPSYIPDSIHALELDGILGCNGAYIVIHNKYIKTDFMDVKWVNTLISMFNEAQVCFMLEAKTSCYVSDIQDHNYQAFMTYYKMDPKGYSQLDENSAIDQVFKVTLFLDNEIIRAKWATYFEQLGYQVSCHRGVFSMDFGIIDVSKGNAIRFLMNHFQLSRNVIYAFGDGDNDYDMLKEAGCGIAMGICHDCLLEVCDMQTLSVKEEGIYVALKQLGLISDNI